MKPKVNTKLIAKAVVFDETGRILVLTRSATDERRPGGVDFPGGNVDEGEDILAAVSREIQEESGLVVAPSELRMIYTNASNQEADGNIVLRFLCVAEVKSTSEITLSFEHSDYTWMSLEEVLDSFEVLSWAKGLRFAIENNVFLANSLQ